jgi:type I restriction enzyme S subunit
MTFEARRLGDVAEIIGGGTPSTKDAGNWDGDIPWLTPKDLSTFEGIYIDHGSRSITEQGFKTSSARMLPTGSVLYTSRAPIGYVAIASNPISTNQGFKSLILKDGYVPEFVFYLLKASKSEIEAHASGGTFAEISAKALSDVVLRFPPKVQQQAISRLLKSFDEKIAANNAISETLEDISQTIFKSWFIDFDPVRAKMAGEKPVGMDAATAALFPDSMQDSEIGMIPKGWKAETIGSICESVVNGSTPLRTNSSFWNSNDISWFKTGELSDNFLFESKESISQLALKKTSVKVLPRGSVLMAIYAAPTVGRLGILTKSASFNQACTGMIAKDVIGMPYLYLTLFNRRAWFNSLAIGAAQQNISKVIVEACPAVIASQEIHNAFLEVIEPIFAQIEVLSSQSNSLALIRDSLLPRLISGELQIPGEVLAL